MSLRNMSTWHEMAYPHAHLRRDLSSVLPLRQLQGPGLGRPMRNDRIDQVVVSRKERLPAHGPDESSASFPSPCRRLPPSAAHGPPRPPPRTQPIRDAVHSGIHRGVRLRSRFGAGPASRPQAVQPFGGGAQRVADPPIMWDGGSGRGFARCRRGRTPPAASPLFDDGSASPSSRPSYPARIYLRWARARNAAILELCRVGFQQPASSARSAARRATGMSLSPPRAARGTEGERGDPEELCLGRRKARAGPGSPREPTGAGEDRSPESLLPTRRQV